MQRFLVDFEWVHDRSGQGFELLSAEAPLSRKLWGPSEAGTLQQAAPDIVLTPATNERIVLRGRLEPCRPIETFPKLFDQFSRITDGQALLGFANRFGPLTNDGRDRDRGDDVSALLPHCRQMRMLLDAYTTNRKAMMAQIIGPKGIALGDGPIGEVQAKLVFDPTTEEPLLQFVPKNLVYAIWLQLAQCISGRERLKRCLNCGATFEVGAGTGRRADAIFCSDEHRVNFHSRKRTPLRAQANHV